MLSRETSSVSLHGHRVSYREAGDSGPLVVLVHGITGSATTWEPVIERLARDHRVIAPDLLGHGGSAKPRGDYSLGAYAAGIRDLLQLLGHERATVVGHSLGGGVAMQFAYQFPERCERLVLVNSGGLGREVHPALRAATLPGSEIVLPLIAHPRVVNAGAAVGRWLGHLPMPMPPALTEVARGYASLSETAARLAFVHTLRSVVDVLGQRVDASDRLYLAAVMPTLIVWGARDRIIPVSHGLRAHDAMPGSRLEVFERSGHFPHCDEPSRFADVLLDFLGTTEPAEFDDREVRERMMGRG